MQGGEDSTERKGESNSLSASERRQNRFILGVIIGGAISYYVSGNNVTWTVVGALGLGYLLAKFWK